MRVKDKNWDNLIAQIDESRPTTLKAWYNGDFHEWADKIYEVVNRIVEVEDPIPQLFTVRNQTFNDTHTLLTWRGGTDYPWTPGAVFEKSGGEYKSVELPMDWHNIAVEFPIQQIDAGVITTDAIITNLARDYILSKKRRAFAALATIAPVGGALCTTIAGSTVVATELDPFIRALKNYDTPNNMTLWGISSMLDPIMSFVGFDATSGYSDATKRELELMGVVGQYRGVPIIHEMIETDYMGTNAVPTSDFYLLTGAHKQYRFYTTDASQFSQKSFLEDKTDIMHFVIRWIDGFTLDSDWDGEYGIRRVHKS